MGMPSSQASNAIIYLTYGLFLYDTKHEWYTVERLLTISQTLRSGYRLETATPVKRRVLVE